MASTYEDVLNRRMARVLEDHHTVILAALTISERRWRNGSTDRANTPQQREYYHAQAERARAAADAVMTALPDEEV